MTSSHFLDRIVADAPHTEGIRKDDLSVGDVVMVRTRNSVYSLVTVGDGRFRVTGGWFTAHNAESQSIKVTGCARGARAFLTGLVAVPGMCIEFSNGVCTTRVREVQIIRSSTDTIH